MVFAIAQKRFYFVALRTFSTAGHTQRSPLMAPQRAALAQSESKARFFERVGLDERNVGHQSKYKLILVRIPVRIASC